MYLIMRQVLYHNETGENFMMNDISNFLGNLATNFGFFPNLPIKVAIGAVVVQLGILIAMSLCLMIMNKSQASK